MPTNYIYYKLYILQTYYKDTLTSQLMEKLGLNNIMEVPKITKITLNMGVGEAVSAKKVLALAMDDMRRISGQQPVPTLATKSVAGFKIREGWPIGCKVTLRKDLMYEFYQRLVSVSIPRIRDFRGLNPKTFDYKNTVGYATGLIGGIQKITFNSIDYGVVALDTAATALV